MQLAKGSVIDGFIIGDIAHRGGMAIFYDVSHPDHATPILMKVPLMREGEDPAAIVGFEMEMMILPRLGGPHVPRFIAAGSYSKQPYLAYQRVEGATLQKKMEQLPLPPAEVASLGAKIATALYALHGQHVIHLDLKPANVILQEGDGLAVLIDYGLSHHGQLPDLMAEEFRLPYGTAPFMAPEQVYGIRSDPRSDIFALGVMMYLFATDVRPFGDPQTLAGLKRRVWYDPAPPRKLNPAVPPWLQDIILRCLSPDPEARHPTAAQLAFDLTHPEQVQLTPRAEKLQRDAWSVRTRRRFNPDAFRPVHRKTSIDGRLNAAPIVAVAIDLAEDHRDISEVMRHAVTRILSTVPGARLACINVQQLNRIMLDQALDVDGNSIHAQRLAQLRDWARPIPIGPERITCHVLESTDPAEALLDYARSNNVDHIVLGASATSMLRQLLGSVATTIVANAPCTVTVVRQRAQAPADGGSTSDKTG
jgi:eukaryotic-like serine/threonine-protein kinase